MDQFNQLFTASQSPAHDPDVRAAILRDIRTMDRELEAERRHIWASYLWTRPPEAKIRVIHNLHHCLYTNNKHQHK